MIDAKIIADLIAAGVRPDLVERVDRLRAELVLRTGRSPSADLAVANARTMRAARVAEAPEQRRVRASIERLYPAGLPGRDALTPGDLVKAVQNEMEAIGARAATRTTILRTVGWRND